MTFDDVIITSKIIDSTMRITTMQHKFSKAKMIFFNTEPTAQDLRALEVAVEVDDEDD